MQLKPNKARKASIRINSKFITLTQFLHSLVPPDTITLMYNLLIDSFLFFPSRIDIP